MPQRFRRSFHCPVCGGFDDANRGEGVRCFGYLSDDGKWAYCTREEHAGDAPHRPSANAWCHRMEGSCKCGVNHGTAPEPPKETPRNRYKAELDKVYDYTDEEGNLLFQVCRLKPKSFRQRQPAPDHNWTWNIKGVRRVLYRLPELIARPDEVVFLVEGEKDADRLASQGLLSTTCAMGAKKWRPEYSEVLRGREVVIPPDNDDDGRQHAEQVAKALKQVGCTIRVVELPGLGELGEHADVSDWLNAGNSIEDLKATVEAAAIWEKPKRKKKTAADTPEDTGKYNRSDTGNAMRLIDMFGKKIRYCGQLGGWYIWNSIRWRRDESEDIYLLAQETVAEMFVEAEALGGSARASLTKWAVKSEDATRIRNMVAMARSRDEVKAKPELFDSDPWLLNCLNGVIDLRTGELKPHDPELFLTKLCPVEYDPEAKSELWDKFLARVVPEDDLLAFLQQSSGYSLTGLTTEEKMFFIYGDTATGKGTFIESVLAVLGDYAKTVSFDTFLRTKDMGGPRNDLAGIKGSRLVVAQEVNEGRRMDEGIIKSLVSGDRVSARFLHKEFFEFTPICAIWLVANDRPRVRDDDNAMWRRILQLPFNEKIPDAEQDGKVKIALKDVTKNGPAILKWLVDGCRWWQINGFTVPASVREATAEYRMDMDPIAEWMQEKVELDPHGNVTTLNAAAWQSYQNWCRDNNVKYSIGRKKFTSRLRQKFKQGRDGRTRFWVGFGLVESKMENDWSSDDEEREPFYGQR